MKMTDKMDAPMISVVMPAYRARSYVAQAIRSVMDQTVTDWELWVIDDCSDDGTYEAAMAQADGDPRIRVLQNSANLGVSETRNRGLALCRGEYIALLDSDDRWHPDKLERQLARLEAENADMVYSSYCIIDADGNQALEDYIVPDKLDFDRMLRENVVGCSTVLVRREWMRERRFGTAFYHEDYVLWLGLLRDGCRAVGCAEPLVDWRLSENSRSYDKRESAKHRWRIYREYLHLPVGKSIRSFCAYALAGARKYLKRVR